MGGDLPQWAGTLHVSGESISLPVPLTFGVPMRRLGPVLLIMLLHFAATFAALYLSIAAVARQLGTSSPETLADRIAEIAAWILASPLVSAAYYAGVNLLHGPTLYILAGLNSALWAALLYLLWQWKGRRVPAGRSYSWVA